MNEDPESRSAQDQISPILLSAWHRICHEIKHPVTSIRFAAEEASRLSKTARDPRRPLQDIVQYCELLDRVIEDASALFAPMDAGRLRKRRYGGPAIRAEIKKQINSVEHFSRERKHRVIVGDGVNQPPFSFVTIDLRSFAQITHELIANAVKYCDVETEIKVDLQRNPDVYRFLVHNVCSSATNDMASMCFQEGWRDTLAIENRRGLGLGLTAAKRLAELNGWKLAINVTPPIITASLELQVEERNE